MFFIRFFICPHCKKVPFCANRSTILPQFQNSAPKIEYRFLSANILSAPALSAIFFKQSFPDFAKVLRFANLFFQSA
ncbi:MAG TPA: hypothetical protein DE061_01980 [Clostridiales bacterium]|nr:hypothetical protein [Clostridiales bacterium]